MKLIYKIQNKKTGEFATASSWSKSGKFWNHISHVKRHINEHFGIENKYDQAELVVYEIVEVSRTPMNDLISEMVEDKKEKQKARESWAKKRMKENLKRQIEEANIKLKELENS